MHHIAKAIVLSLSVVSVVGLTACQSSSATTPEVTQKLPEHQKQHKKSFDGEFKGKHKLTDEERAKIQQHRAQRKAEYNNLTDEERNQKRAEKEKRFAERKAHFEALQKACEGKAGQNITVTIGEKTLEGSCEVHFKPNKPQRLSPPQAS